MSQQRITDEVRAWIVQQAQSGLSAEDTLKALTGSGWDEDVAIDAMESTLRVHLDAQAAAKGLPPAVPVPEPALDDAPVGLEVRGQRIDVLMDMHDPRVVMFGNVLSPEECDALIALAKPQMQRSQTVETKTGGEQVSPERTSEGMFFARAQTPLIAQIEERLAALVNWPIENGEGLQILRYQPGAEYKPHQDYFDPGEPGTPTILKRGGQRVGTIIMYLSEPLAGGGTVFPDVRLQVSPKRGCAVFFSYPRAHASSKTLHGGNPVLRGEKWIATKWMREREFA